MIKKRQETESLQDRVSAAKQQAQIRDLEVLVGKLTDQNQDYANQIQSATVEVGRLRNMCSNQRMCSRESKLCNSAFTLSSVKGFGPGGGDSSVNPSGP